MYKLGKRPIRLRGYYRAVKRGESWALKIDALKEKNYFQWIIALSFRNVEFADILSAENPFLSVLEKSIPFSGKYLPISIIFGDSDV